jgi:hypothetical protein
LSPFFTKLRCLYFQRIESAIERLSLIAGLPSGARIHLAIELGITIEFCVFERHFALYILGITGNWGVTEMQSRHLGHGAFLAPHTLVLNE